MLKIVSRESSSVKIMMSSLVYSRNYERLLMLCTKLELQQVDSKVDSDERL